MAAPRKRPSSTPITGFGLESIEETSKVSEKEEQENVEEFQEVVVNELLEAAELAEEKVEPKVFFEECIVPTEDPGLRFTEKVEPILEETPPVVALKAPPKRHPRNIPKFSRTSK
jgi:hypothetical protein